jgi:hypothetical protein
VFDIEDLHGGCPGLLLVFGRANPRGDMAALLSSVDTGEIRRCVDHSEDGLCAYASGPTCCQDGELAPLLRLQNDCGFVQYIEGKTGWAREFSGGWRLVPDFAACALAVLMREVANPASMLLSTVP